MIYQKVSNEWQTGDGTDDKKEWEKVKRGEETELGVDGSGRNQSPYLRESIQTWEGAFKAKAR